MRGSGRSGSGGWAAPGAERLPLTSAVFASMKDPAAVESDAPAAEAAGALKAPHESIAPSSVPGSLVLEILCPTANI